MDPICGHTKVAQGWDCAEPYFEAQCSPWLILRQDLDLKTKAAIGKSTPIRTTTHGLIALSVTPGKMCMK